MAITFMHINNCWVEAQWRPNHDDKTHCLFKCYNDQFEVITTKNESTWHTFNTEMKNAHLPCASIG